MLRLGEEDLFDRLGGVTRPSLEELLPSSITSDERAVVSFPLSGSLPTMGGAAGVQTGGNAMSQDRRGRNQEKNTFIDGVFYLLWLFVIGGLY